MKVFVAVLVLILGLQSWTKADDIRDFQIEGMSLGDNFLDYRSKKDQTYFNYTSDYDKFNYPYNIDQQSSSRPLDVQRYNVNFKAKYNEDFEEFLKKQF